MKRKFAMICFVAVIVFVFGSCFQSVWAQETESSGVETKDVSKADAASPSASTSLVISQAYGGGGGTSGTYINDYVELKNISSSPQSLTGLSLMYGSATGQFGSSATNIFALPTVTLSPGQYYLVQLSTAGTGGVALPVTPDASTTNLSMSGTNGKVALVTAAFAGNTCGATATPCTLPNAGIIDLVAWGTSNNAEGGASTNGGAALTSVQGNVRKTGGCTDTDNNNADFDIITAPVPRNTVSTATPCSAVPRRALVDFNGDGKSDYAVIRNVGGQMIWYILTNGTGAVSSYAWGLAASDKPVPADFDGDGKSDIAIWRQGAQSYYYILQSATNTVKISPFGQIQDDTSVVGDYDGDGKADESVYRCPQSTPGQCVWYYRGSLNNPSGNITYVPWGFGLSLVVQPVGGDYDGDGKMDFCVRTNSFTGAPALFVLLRSSDFGVEWINWGLDSDAIVPRGDYDGDGKTDFAVARFATNYELYILQRNGGGTGATPIVLGSPAISDSAAFGDYDGDGKTDVGIWREGTGQFWIRQSSNGAIVGPQWGQVGDAVPNEWIFPNS